MNFIAETNKHARAIENWKNGRGFSDREALQDLANIWDEFKNIPERRAVIYQGALGNLPKTQLDCGNCIFDMLTMVYNWRKLLENEVVVDIPNVPKATVETVDFKGIDTPEVKAIKEGIDKLVEADFEKGFSQPDYSKLKMHELRSKAKRMRIEYSNKTTKEELIKLISEKG